MAGTGAATLGSPGLRPQMQVNQKCGGSAVMARQVAHEHVYHVVIETQVGPHAHILL